MRIRWIGLLLLLATVTVSSVRTQGGYDPTVQAELLLNNEARTVYLGNLARQDHGLPPLRWNRELTHAARWYSWDSTENREPGFCGHQDTQGQWPDYRAYAFGYLGRAGAENAFCGYLAPENAIEGWMNSPGHRANLLDPNSREIGLGYYQRGSDGRGYVTQDFGNDPVYAPVIIENEAISTTSSNVNLYIYDRPTEGGFAGSASATQMIVSNDACFSQATWEPYTADKAWTLAAGEGWRDVYVKTRDRFSRTLTVSDSIYLGAQPPLHELGAAQMSTNQAQVTLYHLNGETLPQVQFSLGWLADDTFETFNKWWGNGERVNDAAAWGGTAYWLYPGDGESFAWVNDTTFIKDTPLVAYFRLKVNDNTSNSEVARISVNGGGTEYGPLILRGTDFAAADQYQEFALDFTFNSNPDEPFLTFQFWRSGSADVYVDAVSIFSTPQPITAPLTWAVPGGNYRGQGVWARYTDGSQFSALTEAVTTPSTFSIAPTALSFHAALNGNPPAPATLSITQDCPFRWQVSHDAAWLQTQVSGNSVEVRVDQSGLSNGVYTGTLTLAALDTLGIPPVTTQVQLVVDETGPVPFRVALPVAINAELVEPTPLPSPTLDPLATPTVDPLATPTAEVTMTPTDTATPTAEVTMTPTDTATPTALPLTTWLELVNAYRTQAGVPPVTEDLTLSANCFEHARYMAENNHLTHAQNPTLPWASPAGAICASKGNAWLGGSFSRPYWTINDSINGWMSSPGHRFWLLYPTTPTFGYGFYTANNNRAGAGLDVLSLVRMDLDTAYTGWPVRYPAPNQTNVPATDDPISLGWRYFGTVPELQSVVLRTANGQTLEYTTTTTLPVNHKGILITPAAPLPASTSIIVEVTGSYDGTPFSYQWQFTTGAQ